MLLLLSEHLLLSLNASSKCTSKNTLVADLVKICEWKVDKKYNMLIKSRQEIQYVNQK